MSDNTCKTCRWFDPERSDQDAGECRRYPMTVYRDRSTRYWCGEWEEAEVTDEHTICNGFGVPMFKVTERENGTSVTEPIPDEAHDELDRLKSENAKLRELVRYMWQSDYARNFSTLKEDVELRAMVYQRIKQLGVEVD